MANKLLELNPYSEIAIKRVMGSLVTLGDRPAAAKALVNWKTSLAKDLEIVDDRSFSDFV